MDELSNILGALKENLRIKTGSARATFDLWFGDLNLVSLTESKAVFSTPTKLRRKILTTRYINLINETLEELLGFTVEIDIYSLDEDKNFSQEEKEKISVTSTLPESNNIEEEDEEKEIEKVLNSSLKEPSDQSFFKKSILDDYTFDNFIEGSSNKFAKAACYAVAKDPCYYNPLFIYGQSGLGKTHLLYAVMNYMKKNNPKLKIVYKKSETFINELIDAIGTNTTIEFKEKYRTADVLLIDDIQFLAGKESTQEEFFHTFSALYESEKQIILTSDRPPMEIKPLTDRLRTRFEGGLLADVQPPSFELRTAIIRKKANDLGLILHSTDVDYIAERLNSNIRQIEGVLKKLYAIYSLTGVLITREHIDQVISIIDPGNIPNDVMVERILSAVSKKYGVSVEDIKSKKKTDNIAGARHVSIYITRELTDLSLKEIGKVFGRDHSTVMSSINKIQVNIRTIKNYENDIDSLMKEIKG